MLGFTKRLLTKAVAISFKSSKIPIRYYFCAQNTTLNAAQIKIKQLFFEKGRQSEEYRKEMGKNIREALEKYDQEAAIGLELFHLNLIKQTQGETSQIYRSQIREIVKFCINQQQFETAAKLIEELQNVQAKIQGISPLDVLATLYLQGHVHMLMGKLQQSKQIFQECLKSEYVKQSPEIFFKIRAELAKVFALKGEAEEAYQKLQECEILLQNRAIDEKAPFMIIMMQLGDIYTLADLASMLNDENLAKKYLEMYEEKLEKFSNKQDQAYVQFLEKSAKIYFNLKQFQKSIDFLKKASNLSGSLAKKDPRFNEYVTIFNNIIESMTKEHLKK